MDLLDNLDATKLVAIGFLVATFSVFAGTIVAAIGRALAKTKYTRLSEALLRLGMDIKGAGETLKTEVGTPSVSAQPLPESSKAIVESAAGPSVAPPALVKAESEDTPTNPKIPADPKLPPIP